MNDSVNQTRAFEILTATPVRTRRKPRDWSAEEKARLIAETLQPGANVSAIARAEGLDPSQLYGWRRKAVASGSVAPVVKAADEQVGSHVSRRLQVPRWKSSLVTLWCASAAISRLNTWRRSSGRSARHDRVRCHRLRVVPACRLPQRCSIFDGSGQRWWSRPVQRSALCIPVETGGPCSHCLVGWQRGLPLFENPRGEWLLLAGSDGSAYPPRPCSAHGSSGWLGLEEDPSSDDQEAALHRLNRDTESDICRCKC